MDTYCTFKRKELKYLIDYQLIPHIKAEIARNLEPEVYPGGSSINYIRSYYLDNSVIPCTLLRSSPRVVHLRFPKFLKRTYHG